MKKILLLSLTLSLLSLSINAQSWKRKRVEYSFGLGVSNFLGDLGGANQVGTNGLKDLELSLTRPALGIGYRYFIARPLAVKGNLIYARVNGDDALTDEPARKQRELKFRSPIWELSAQFEYYLLQQKKGHLYSLRGIKGQSWFRFDVYVFAGIGGIWFNPRGKLNGSWHSLQPLGTEGQGIAGQPAKYSRITAVVPYGIGLKRGLDKRGIWSISLEIGMRNTFSDYIDDVSTEYFDNNLILKNNGEVAAHFADPSGKNAVGTATGEVRGDSSNDDAYILALFSLNYKINKRRRNLPKF